MIQLYHTKNNQGTTTKERKTYSTWIIIPYQEQSGNYNGENVGNVQYFDYTIPRTIRELQLALLRSNRCLIIPYQEQSGNYNARVQVPQHERNYTIPRTIRELQQMSGQGCRVFELYHTKNNQGTTTCR